MITKNKTGVLLVLLGDSDISRWPPSLYPSIQKDTVEDCYYLVRNFARGGAVMADLLSQLQEWRDSNDVGNTLESNIVLFVVCAGENDVSSGQSIDKIQKTFSSFLEKLFCPNLNSGQINTQSSNERLLFLGPKFEPWLSKDYSSRKQYAKLSSAFHRTIRKHPGSHSQNIVYVDCLTMFCTSESKDVPGAVHGGRAMPDPTFFDSDGLHLSDDGYELWKVIIEKDIRSKILS